MISTTLETQDLIIRRTAFDDLDQFFLWEPVSYTHLDVSKRQGLKCPRSVLR